MGPIPEALTNLRFVLAGHMVNFVILHERVDVGTSGHIKHLLV